MSDKREHLGLLADADHQWCDADECWCHAPIGEQRQEFLGATCAKCSHVHMSLVCSCGCDISGELLKVDVCQDREQAAFERGRRERDLTAQQLQDIHSIINRWSTDVVDYENAVDDVNAYLFGGIEQPESRSLAQPAASTPLKWICPQCKHEHHTTSYCGVITEAGGCMCRNRYVEPASAGSREGQPRPALRLLGRCLTAIYLELHP